MLGNERGGVEKRVALRGFKLLHLRMEPFDNVAFLRSPLGSSTAGIWAALRTWEARVFFFSKDHKKKWVSCPWRKHSRGHIVSVDKAFYLHFLFFAPPVLYQAVQPLLRNANAFEYTPDPATFTTTQSIDVVPVDIGFCGVLTPCGVEWLSDASDVSCCFLPAA